MRRSRRARSRYSVITRTIRRPRAVYLARLCEASGDIKGRSVMPEARGCARPRNSRVFARASEAPAAGAYRPGRQWRLLPAAGLRRGARSDTGFAWPEDDGRVTSYSPRARRRSRGPVDIYLPLVRNGCSRPSGWRCARKRCSSVVRSRVTGSERRARRSRDADRGEREALMARLENDGSPHPGAAAKSRRSREMGPTTIDRSARQIVTEDDRPKATSPQGGRIADNEPSIKGTAARG